MGRGKGPLLEQWSIIENGINQKILTGVIFNDHRFADGTIIYTTPIKEISEEKGRAMTRNTKYLLGIKKLET